MYEKTINNSFKGKDRINMKLSFFEKLEQYKDSFKEVYINNIYQNIRIDLRFILNKS